METTSWGLVSMSLAESLTLLQVPSFIMTSCDSASLNLIFICKIWVTIPHTVGTKVKRDGACDFVFYILKHRANQGIFFLPGKYMLCELGAACILHSQEVNYGTEISANISTGIRSWLSTYLQNRNRVTYRENKHMVTKGEAGEG